MLRSISKSLHKVKFNNQLNSGFLCKQNPRSNLILSPTEHFNFGHYRLQFFFSDDKGGYKKKLSKQELFKARQQQLMKQQPDQDPTSYDRASSRGGKIFMASSVLLMVAGLAYIEYKNRKTQTQIDQNISGMLTIKEKKKVKIGGQWSLIDHRGKPFSTSDLSDSYYLIYFGFTKCPDICPATLIKLSRVLRLIRKMPQNDYINLKVIFVSCDPERDTPQRMKQYLKNFDQQIIGVTGTSSNDPQLKNCMKNFKIYANKIPLENDQYSIDHTTITYLMDQNNEYVDHLNPTLTEQQMAKAIVNRILEHDYSKMQKRKQKTAQIKK